MGQIWSIQWLRKVDYRLKISWRSFMLGVVPKMLMAFPLCIAMTIDWKMNDVDLTSPVASAILEPRSWMNFSAIGPQAPIVSVAVANLNTTDPPSKQKKNFFVTFHHYFLNEIWFSCYFGAFLENSLSKQNFPSPHMLAVCMQGEGESLSFFSQASCTVHGFA